MRRRLKITARDETRKNLGDIKLSAKQKAQMKIVLVLEKHGHDYKYFLCRCRTCDKYITAVTLEEVKAFLVSCDKHSTSVVPKK